MKTSSLPGFFNLLQDRNHFGWDTASTKWGNIAKHGKAMLLDRYDTRIFQVYIENMALALGKGDSRVQEWCFL